MVSQTTPLEIIMNFNTAVIYNGGSYKKVYLNRCVESLFEANKLLGRPIIYGVRMIHLVNRHGIIQDKIMTFTCEIYNVSEFKGLLHYLSKINITKYIDYTKWQAQNSRLGVIQK